MVNPLSVAHSHTHPPRPPSGALAAAVACPADVVLVRMQADGRLPPPLRRNYRHVLHGAAAICRSAEGPRACGPFPPLRPNPSHCGDLDLRTH